jgi:hypothetical protein
MSPSPSKSAATAHLAPIALLVTTLRVWKTLSDVFEEEGEQKQAGHELPLACQTEK